MDTHRIKVKLGDAEFEAEGKPEALQAQYDAFLAAVSSLPKQRTATDAAGPEVTNGPAGKPSGNTTDPPRELLDRVFRKDDHLSLAALPAGDNAVQDAVLALLYGYLKLEGQPTVTGTMLNKSARISGVNIERVDRVMAGLMPDFVRAAGVKKARRYQLNNPGLSRAEKIVKEILQ